MSKNTLEREKHRIAEPVNDAQVKEALARCLESLNNVGRQLPNLSNNKALLKGLVREFSDYRSELVRRVLPNHPLFGYKYCSKLSHDLDPVALLWDGIYYHESPPIQGLKAAITTIRHLLGSIEPEFGVNYSQADLSQLTKEVIDYFKSVNEILRPLGEWEGFQTKFISHLEPNQWLVFTQEDALFRILYNLTTNSRRAIWRKYGEQGAGGEIKFSARRQENFILLDIRDNGAGFGWFFQKINLKTAKEEIPLTEVLKHGEGISQFKESGFGGTGGGLGICQHLADLIGAKIFIANPEKIEGARVSIKLPTPNDPVKV